MKRSTRQGSEIRKTIQVTGIAVILVVAFIAAVPAHVELTVVPAEGGGGVVAGWLASNDDARVALDDQTTPWKTQLSARGLKGSFEAGGNGQLTVRARMFKGPLLISELNLAGARVSLVNGPGGFSGRAR